MSNRFPFSVYMASGLCHAFLKTTECIAINRLLGGVLAFAKKCQTNILLFFEFDNDHLWALGVWLCRRVRTRVSGRQALVPYLLGLRRVRSLGVGGLLPKVF